MRESSELAYTPPSTFSSALSVLAGASMQRMNSEIWFGDSFVMASFEMSNSTCGIVLKEQQLQFAPRRADECTRIDIDWNVGACSRSQMQV